jgi:NAD-dependent DNA ligase
MREFLEKASVAYYSGYPLISDAEFDALSAKYGYNAVGHAVTDGIPHLHKMYSLQKVFSIDDIPTPNSKYICTPKLDGAAVSLTYINGHLALGLTRGDGNLGRDITDKLELLVPNNVSFKGEVFITGEVVCPSNVTNARNVAAGSLNLKDLEEFKTRPLTFVAYDVQGVQYELYTEALSLLAQEGFNTVDTFDYQNYPTDGMVYRINSRKSFDKMGHTAHHPRGAFALKEQKDGVHTELLDVVWQVGKSGVVSPVAILSPVEVEGAIVSRATLHNIEYIRSLDLEIGCMVEVIRSGEIIPRILGRVDQKKNNS